MTKRFLAQRKRVAVLSHGPFCIGKFVFLRRIDATTKGSFACWEKRWKLMESARERKWKKKSCVSTRFYRCARIRTFGFASLIDTPHSWTVYPKAEINYIFSIFVKAMNFCYSKILSRKDILFTGVACFNYYISIIKHMHAWLHRSVYYAEAWNIFDLEVNMLYNKHNYKDIVYNLLIGYSGESRLFWRVS